MPQPCRPFQRYLEIKTRHPRSTIFFRNGDRYEIYAEDAALVSQLLELSLGTVPESIIPMATFPESDLESICAKMVNAKKRVFIDMCTG